MTLKKPSDLFGKKEASSVFETPEVSPHITESYNKFVDNFETVNEITEKTKVFEKVDELSERIELLSKELSEKLSRTDLENAMLSQLMVLDENFKTIQSQVKGLNKEDLREFRSTVSDLSQVVDNLVETELPKYKNQLVKSKVFVEEQVQELQEIVEENITGIREEIDEKFVSIVEVIDNNLEHFSNQLQETSSQVKKTADTYNKISKIVENKISQENEKFEEYSELIENLSQAFEQLALVLKEELCSSSQFIEEKFEDYKKEFESISSNLEASFDDISSNLEASVDVRLEDYHKEILDIKAEVVINEQHIKNVDKYLQKHHHELIELREEVFTEIEQIPVGNLQENLERLEKKIDYIKETYSKIQPEVIVKEVIKEGLLNEPPETDNSDSVTPLNQNFVTLDQLQEHYRLFINRIQQQLSTLGGGGETKLKYLDDIVGIATNASAYDGKFLKYDHSLGKFVFETVSGGGGGGSQTLDQTLKLGNTSSLGMSVGVVTATSFNGNATSATYATTAGIATYSTTAGVSTSVIGGIGSVTQLRVSGVSTLGITTFTGAVSFGTSAYFGTNDNLVLGNNNNLQLYYNGSNSLIDASVGLILKSTSTTYQGDAHTFQNSDQTKTYATFISSGSAFYQNNNTKLEIIGAGITVTGTTFTNSLRVSGVTTSTGGFVGDLTGNASSATYATTAGIATVAQGLTGTPDISVNNLNVSGVGTFQSSGLQIRNPANTFGYTIAGGAIATDRTLNLPVIATGTDTLAVLGSPQTFIAAQVFNSTLTASSTFTLSSSTTSNNTIATNSTTGTLVVGGTTQTGTMTLGRSTASQQTDIQAGASGVGSSKTINFGTGGLSGSFTNINIGPTAGVGTVVINSGTSLLVGSATSTGTASQRLQVTGGGYFSGNVGIGTTLSNEVLSVLPKIQILNNSNADGRLILRAKPGNAYRWNIDNDGTTNNFRFFREDDANAANGTTPFQITPTGDATLTGNLNAAGNYYVKLARTSNQTINNGSDTVIAFSAISDGNSWFNSGNSRITPTVAGNYCINAMVKWEAGAATNTVQSNIQIRKTGNTVALSVFGVQTHTYTMNVSAIVTMNGSTDYIELTAYTGNPTSQVVTGDAGGTLTKLEMFKLN